MSEPVHHKAKLGVDNQYGEELVRVVVRHRVDNDPDSEDERRWSNVPNGHKTLDDRDIHFQTNPGQNPPRDFWYASIELSGQEQMHTTDDYTCDLHEGDENKDVWGIILKEGFQIQTNEGSCPPTPWIKVARRQVV